MMVPAERYHAERLCHQDALDLPGRQPPPGVPAPAPGDRALLVAATRPPVVFGEAEVTSAEPLRLAYRRRGLDRPPPAHGLALDDGLTPVDEQTYTALTARLGRPADRRAWLVSVHIPIEAESAAEAVREFWSYVTALGPGELPAFVAPVGNELAMEAYVSGAPTSLDPESDDE